MDNLHGFDVVNCARTMYAKVVAEISIYDFLYQGNYFTIFYLICYSFIFVFQLQSKDLKATKYLKKIQVQKLNQIYL